MQPLRKTPLCLCSKGVYKIETKTPKKLLIKRLKKVIGDIDSAKLWSPCGNQVVNHSSVSKSTDIP